jgi:TonB family protein
MTMAFEDVMSEFAEEGGGPTNKTAISLDDLLARGTVVYWHEAVAIIEEMCDVSLAASGDTAPVPELADVLIGQQGTVTLRNKRGEKSPTAAGRALHALLSNTDVPVPLRLFVTQSTAAETHHSLRAFAAGLAYFGRPNRTALIHEVYKRAADLTQSGAAAAQAPPRLPVQEKKPEKESPKTKRSHAGRPLIWAAVGVLVAAAAGAAGGWWKAGSRAGATKTVGVLSQASAVLTDLANQVRERLNPAVPTATQGPDEAPATPSRPRPKRRISSTSVTVDMPLASRPVSIAQSSAWQLAIAVPTVAASVPALPVDEPPPPDIDVLFTRQDANVEPPMLRYPQLTPPPVLPTSREVAVNRVEVVVAPDGTVERIRFVDGPVRMADVLLVQAVKTWKFTPALKDGGPVRYQTVVTWSAVP